jgi:hypothetical protein
MATVDALADWAVLAPENDPMLPQFVAVLQSPEMLQTMAQRPFEVVEELAAMVSAGESFESLVERLTLRFQPELAQQVADQERAEAEAPEPAEPGETPEPLGELEARVRAMIGDEALAGIRQENRTDEAYRAVLVELEQKLAEIEAPLSVEVPEGNEFEVFHGRGRGEKAEVYAEGVEGPILGPGKYYAFSEREAQAYGPEVTRETVTVENPLRITSDQELLKIVGRDLDILSIEGQGEAGRQLRAYAEKHGHDAIVIEAPWGRDMNAAGESHKRIRSMFGGSQLVVLREAGEEEAPTLQQRLEEYREATAKMTRKELEKEAKSLGLGGLSKHTKNTLRELVIRTAEIRARQVEEAREKAEKAPALLDALDKLSDEEILAKGLKYLRDTFDDIDAFSGEEEAFDEDLGRRMLAMRDRLDRLEEKAEGVGEEPPKDVPKEPEKGAAKVREEEILKEASVKKLGYSVLPWRIVTSEGKELSSPSGEPLGWRLKREATAALERMRAGDRSDIEEAEERHAAAVARSKEIHEPKYKKAEAPPEIPAFEPTEPLPGSQEFRKLEQRREQLSTEISGWREKLEKKKASLRRSRKPQTLADLRRNIAAIEKQMEPLEKEQAKIRERISKAYTEQRATDEHPINRIRALVELGRMSFEDAIKVSEGWLREHLAGEGLSPQDAAIFASKLAQPLVSLTGTTDEDQIARWVKSTALELAAREITEPLHAVPRELFKTPEVGGKVDKIKALSRRDDLSLGELLDQAIALGEEINAYLAKERRLVKAEEKRQEELEASAAKRARELEEEIAKGGHLITSASRTLRDALVRLVEQRDARYLEEWQAEGGFAPMLSKPQEKAMVKAGYLKAGERGLALTPEGLEASKKIREVLDLLQHESIEFRQPVKPKGLADPAKVRSDVEIGGKLEKVANAFTAREATRYAMNAPYWAEGEVVGTDGRTLIVIPTKHSRDPGVYVAGTGEKIEAVYPDYRAVLHHTNQIGVLTSAAIYEAGVRPPDLKPEEKTSLVKIGDNFFDAGLIERAGRALLDLGIQAVHAYQKDSNSPLELYEAGATKSVKIAVMGLTPGAGAGLLYSTLPISETVPKKARRKKKKAPEGMPGEAPPGGPGAIGTPSIFRGLPAGERKAPGRVTKDDIWERLTELSGATIRQGRARFKAGTVGWYRDWNHVIRMRESRPLAVMAHEFGHAMDKKLLGKERATGADLPPAVRSELSDLGFTLYGDEEPANGYVAEGFAEFVARYLMASWWNGEDMATVTPATYRWFFDTVLAGHPTEAGFHQVRGMYDLFYLQGSLGRVDASIAWDDETASLLRKAGEDDLQDWMMVDRARAEQLGRSLEFHESLHAQALSLQATAESIAKSFLLDHTVNLKGEITGKSLKEALKPIGDREREWWVFMKALRDLTLVQTVQNDRAEYAERIAESNERERQMAATDPDYEAKIIREPTDEELVRKFPEIDTGISHGDARWVVEQLDNATFREAAIEYTAFMDRVLDFLVDSGVMTMRAKERLRERHPIYLPLNRVFDDAERVWVRKARKRGGLGGRPIKKISGSTRLSRDPLTLTIQQVHNSLNAAQKARFAREIVKVAEKEDMGWLAEKVTKPMRLIEARLSAFKEQLEAAGLEMDGTDLDYVLSLWTNTHSEFAGRPIVAIVRRGETEYWEIKDPDLYTTLMELDKNVSAVGIRLLAVPGTLVRMGAVQLSLPFAIKNALMRDPALAPVFSSTFFPGVGGFYEALVSALADARNAPVVKGIIDRIPAKLRKFGAKVGKRAETAAQMRAAGGEFVTFAQQVRVGTTRVWRERLSPVSHKERLLEIGRNPLLAVARLPGVLWKGVAIMQEAIGRTELWVRNPEFEARLAEGKEKYGDTEMAVRYALYHAKDVMNNYSRAGVIARSLGPMYPFFTARIAGASKELRVFALLRDIGGKRTRRWPAAVMRAIAGLTLPSLMLWWLFKDEEWYQEIEEWMRRGFWVFSFDGGETIWKIPKPWTLAEVFSNKLEMLLLEQEESLLGEAGEIARQLSPVSNIMGTIPILLRPAVEAATYTRGFGSESFFSPRRTISPFELRNKEPQDIARPWTSGFAKWVASWLPGDWSPIQIDAMVYGYTGGLGTQLLRVPDVLLEKAEGVRKVQPADWPILGTFVKRESPTASRTVREMWDDLERLRRKRGSGTLTPLETLRLPALEKASKAISEILDRWEQGMYPRELAAQLVLLQARMAQVIK